MKNVGNSSRGRSQGVTKIQGTDIYIGRIARSSLRQHSFLVDLGPLTPKICFTKFAQNRL